MRSSVVFLAGLCVALAACGNPQADEMTAKSGKTASGAPLSGEGPGNPGPPMPKPSPYNPPCPSGPCIPFKVEPDQRTVNPGRPLDEQRRPERTTRTGSGGGT